MPWIWLKRCSHLDTVLGWQPSRCATSATLAPSQLAVMMRARWIRLAGACRAAASLRRVRSSAGSVGARAYSGGLAMWSPSSADGDQHGADRPTIPRLRNVALGPDDPDTAITLNNLAGVLRAQGDLQGARTLYERVLTIREAQLGPDDPDTAITLNNLAGVLHDQGDLDSARDYYERALATFEHRLGPTTPSLRAAARALPRWWRR
jgi:tetratricopeptide (TPR) repeat protein